MSNPGFSFQLNILFASSDLQDENERLHKEILNGLKLFFGSLNEESLSAYLSDVSKVAFLDKSWSKLSVSLNPSSKLTILIDLFENCLKPEDKIILNIEDDNLELVKDSSEQQKFLINSWLERRIWPPNYILDDKYEIIELLKHPTRRYEVYKAKERLRFRDTVIIKRLRPSIANDRNAYERCKREAYILRKISHSLVLADRGIEIGEFGNPKCYFLTEFADKGSLREYLENIPNHKLFPVEALETMLSICKAIDVVHGQGIIHCDIKSDNVLLFSSLSTDENTLPSVKIADFSIAHIPDEWSREWVDTTSLPFTDLPFGQLGYAAPERIKSNGNSPDKRSDVFSLAMVFYEMLTGEKPELVMPAVIYSNTFNGFDERFFLNKDIPVEFVIILCKALQLDLEHRYQSVREFQEALETIKPQFTTEQINLALEKGDELNKSLRWDEAIKQFEQGLIVCKWHGEIDKLTGKFTHSIQNLEAGLWYAYGARHYDMREWNLALEYLKRIQNRETNDINLRTRIAEMIEVSELRLTAEDLVQQRKYEKALDELTGHTRFAPVAELMAVILDVQIQKCQNDNCEPTADRLHSAASASLMSFSFEPPLHC